ncbi:Sodium/calcium exchanger protein-domain-containing protein [Flammula alnicola]|nr:Sodium/calcium exchanger protein-domain-containing protein [Flammula alnicola]
MGESSTLSVHNVFTSVLPQPTPPIAEDDDEPPSSGTRNDRAAQVKTRQNCVPTSEFIHVGVQEKDFAKIEHVERNGTTPAYLDELGNVDSQHVHRRGLRGSILSKIERLGALFTPRLPAGPRPTYCASFMAAFRYTPFNLLLLCIPVSWALHYTHKSSVLIFIFSGLGIVPLAALLGLGTEQLALSTSQNVGGLLNASLGNLLEMIISGIALKQCELEVVQSTLLGGLLSNLLLVLGCSFIVGGFKFHQQQFQPMVAQLNSSLMIVSVISLMIPAAFHQYLETRLAPGTEVEILLELSRASAIILIMIYIAYLFFQFYSHKHLFLDTFQECATSSQSSSGSSFGHQSTQTLPLPTAACSSSSSSSSSDDEEVAKLNISSALLLLVAVTGLAYLTAECLVDSLDGLVASHPSISKEWITLIVIPIISNAAEHTTAVIVARKGKFDLAMAIAVGSCIQIALFVIPVLVLVAWGMGKPLTLLFDPLETIVLFLSVLLVKFSVEGGKSHWMSGLVLIAVYILIAVSFWYFPHGTGRVIQGQGLQCSVTFMFSPFSSLTSADFRRVSFFRLLFVNSMPDIHMSTCY